MENWAGVVQQLQQERARATREVEQLDAALAALNGSHGNGTGTRGKMSAEGEDCGRSASALGEGEGG
jgi:hypothetical protein